MPIKTNLEVSVPSREKFKQRIKLISAGAAHPLAFPDGEITIFPWDIQVDDWVVTKGKMQKTSTYDLIPQLADLNGCPVEDLFVGDATTVLLVARSLRHNNSIQFSPTCPHCDKQNPPETIKIPEQLRKKAEKPLGWPGIDTITLPECKDVVVIRPLRVKDEKFIDSRTPEEVKAVPTLTAHILLSVVTINDTKADSVRELMQWFRAMQATDQDYLSQQIDDLHPRLDNDVEFLCDFCQEKFTHTLDLGKPFLRS